MFCKKKRPGADDKQARFNDIMAAVQEQLGDRERHVTRREAVLADAFNEGTEVVNIAIAALHDLGHRETAKMVFARAEKVFGPARSK